jgi:uncharacterized OB-fold protein
VSAPAAAPPAGPLTLAEFFAGVRAGRVEVQRCAACGLLAVPPKATCPDCHGTGWGRAALDGAGEVTSYTVIRVPPARLAAEAPYAVVVVRMAEGISLLGRLVGAGPEAARVGLPVRLAAPLGDAAQPVLAFAPRA